MLVTIYNDTDAESVAQNFFEHYYHDRGKKKWQGFFLSDNIAALRKYRDYIDGTKKIEKMKHD